MDEVKGDRFDTAWADQPAELSHSLDGRSLATPNPGSPTAVHRKSKPSDLGMVGAIKFDFSTENVVYLRLSEALETGKTVRAVVSRKRSGRPSRSPWTPPGCGARRFTSARSASGPMIRSRSPFSPAGWAAAAG